MTSRKRKPRFTPRNHPWQPTDEQLLCRDLQHSWTPYTAKRRADGFIRTRHEVVQRAPRRFRERRDGIDGVVGDVPRVHGGKSNSNRGYPKTRMKALSRRPNRKAPMRMRL